MHYRFSRIELKVKVNISEILIRSKKNNRNDSNRIVLEIKSESIQ